MSDSIEALCARLELYGMGMLEREAVAALREQAAELRHLSRQIAEGDRLITSWKRSHDALQARVRELEGELGKASDTLSMMDSAIGTDSRTIRDLRAENERLKQHYKGVPHDWVMESIHDDVVAERDALQARVRKLEEKDRWPMHSALMAQVHALRAENETLRKDAARIRHFFSMARTPITELDEWRAEQDQEMAAIAMAAGEKP